MVPAGYGISEVTTFVSENVTQNVRNTDMEPRTSEIVRYKVCSAAGVNWWIGVIVSG